MTRRRVVDDELDGAVGLAVSVLGGAVLPALSCQYGGCEAEGALHRNGVWCNRHARKMERVLS